MNNKYKKLFIIIESIIYLTFLVLDIKGISSTIVKYIGILLCFVYTLINKKNYGRIALFFTCLADLFLLVLNKYYIVGVSFFIFVQVTYIFYLDKLNIDLHFKLRILIPLIACIVLAFLNNLSLLNIIVLFYFSQLVISALSLVNKKHKLLCLGLCLFACCDICVGLHNIYIHNSLIAFGQWFFYLPSQVLITLFIG